MLLLATTAAAPAEAPAPDAGEAAFNDLAGAEAPAAETPPTEETPPPAEA